jgi:hypothetical protein
MEIGQNYLVSKKSKVSSIKKEKRGFFKGR